MIFLTGDTHGNMDISKLGNRRFFEGKELDKNSIVIILGDFGNVWFQNNEDKYWLNWLNDKPYTVCFIDGNHENHDLLNSYEVKEWMGGKVHIICDSVIHLMRGQVFELEGLRFFTMGGGFSTDQAYRKEGVSWWKNELPNLEEYNEAKRNLERYDWKVDYVLSHTTSMMVMQNQLNYVKEDTELNRFFDLLEKQLEFRHWYFGHFHQDTKLDEKHTVVYNKILKVNKGE
ncbi:MAG: metallophosphoesterase [Vallitaleaceae bacterium]|nr:metallophosphoesterase [Vallitaleaceae bacterium]